MAELSKSLGTLGIVVDQVTTLDPHPVLTLDPSLTIGTNVLFVDNYYQTNVYPGGEALGGAHNLNFTGMEIDHELVHTFYHGTIDSLADGVDGQLIKQDWYANAVTGPREQVGFAWSRGGTAPRPEDGFGDEAEGRVAIDVSVSGAEVWDNVLFGRQVQGTELLRGELFSTRVGFLDDNNDAVISLGFDTDANPYNGYLAGVAQATVYIGEGAGIWDRQLDTSSLAPGEYFVYAKISNGTTTRYDYTTQKVTVLAPNRAPTNIGLSKNAISEGAGANAIVGTLAAVDPDAGSTFTYSLVSGTGAVDNARFLITGNSLKAIGSFDYETKQSYSIRVRVSDGQLSFEKPFTISVTDVAETEMLLNGTAGHDTVVAALHGSLVRLTLNGTKVSERELALISRIKINGLAGDDSISVAEGISLAAVIDGGEGNDSISGGSGADLIYGGDGNDSIFGGDGVDTIYGNFGDDLIMGGLKRDSLLGGLGNDTITAGDGPDSIYGGDGMDLLRGGKGADWIEGRGKSDTVFGGAHNDTIYGQAGSDVIYGEDGDDVIYAGDGVVFRDTIDGGAGVDSASYDEIDTVLGIEVALLA